MFCENFKEKNEISIHIELPKISMLAKNAIWSFRGLCSICCTNGKDKATQAWL